MDFREFPQRGHAVVADSEQTPDGNFSNRVEIPYGRNTEKKIREKRHVFALFFVTEITRDTLAAEKGRRRWRYSRTPTV